MSHLRKVVVHFLITPKPVKKLFSLYWTWVYNMGW